ncbi:MAG TPA: response regulator [Gemmatimonadales bacterium]|nr:response regulator [Gemmatimonadales bacterium]
MLVLIADDDQVTVQLVSSVLKANGYDVRAAYDSLQAVTLALRDPPDAIILDIAMPAGGGWSVLERLKASSKTRAIPVVVLTALTDPQLPARARALGADAFLVKPVAPNELRSTLERLLNPPPPDGASV